MDPISLETLLKLSEAFGLPVWIIVFVGAVTVTLRSAKKLVAELRARDALLQKVLTNHITENTKAAAQTDKRIALMEQLIERHDDNIESMWNRINSGNFRAAP